MDIPSLQDHVSPEEWALRVDLAAAYRVAAHFGWADLVFTHISARIPGPQDHFLINPYGLMFGEITASSLIRVDQNCAQLSPSPFPVNPAGFVIHSCIHAGRADVGCVLHTHSRAGVAVAAQAGGLLPISQQASLIIPALGYHDYEGVALRPDEQPRLQADLGANSALILRNHGLLTVGATVPEAFLTMYTLENACAIQISAQAGGELIHINPQIMQNMPAVIQMATKGQGAMIAWPALLRLLDRTSPGYRD